MNLKYKKGDKVIIRSDLISGNKYGCWTFNRSGRMDYLKGLTVSIDDIFIQPVYDKCNNLISYNYGYQIINTSSSPTRFWYLTDEMIERMV